MNIGNGMRWEEEWKRRMEGREEGNRGRWVRREEEGRVQYIIYNSRIYNSRIMYKI
jgi:hypothetical protein